MPYKFFDSRRGKFQKGRYRVTNWPAYNESLRRRGDLTIWVSEDVALEWTAGPRQTRGGQRKYSDLAIEICLTLRVAFRLAAAPDPRLYAVNCEADGVSPAGAGFLDPFTAWQEPEGGTKEPCVRQADHSDCGQHRTEGSQRGWLERSQAWRQRRQLTAGWQRWRLQTVTNCNSDSFSTALRSMCSVIAIHLQRDPSGWQALWLVDFDQKRKAASLVGRVLGGAIAAWAGGQRAK